MAKRPVLITLVLTTLFIGSCSGAATPASAPTPGSDLSGGLLAAFQVDTEQFHVWVDNPETIAQLKELTRDPSLSLVPAGRILPGAGIGEHNAPWSWHFDPDSVEMASGGGVCDQRPAYVEGHLEEIMTAGGRFCPSAAVLLVITEYP